MELKKSFSDSVEKMLRSELSSFIEVCEILEKMPKKSRDKVIDMIKLLYLEETPNDEPDDKQ